MTIADFARAVNSCLPSIQQIEAHYLRVQDRLRNKGLQLATKEGDFGEWQNQMMFKYDDIGQEALSPKEKISQLLLETNIQWRESDFQWKPPGALLCCSCSIHSRFQVIYGQ